MDDRKVESTTDSKLIRPWLRQTTTASTLIIHHPLHDTINHITTAEPPDDEFDASLPNQEPRYRLRSSSAEFAESQLSG